VRCVLLSTSSDIRFVPCFVLYCIFDEFLTDKIISYTIRLYFVKFFQFATGQVQLRNVIKCEKVWHSDVCG
jgi:hypothetical protein